jgi:protein-S-isoprenylcysteine O-methyltransferase Ste14
LIAFAYLPVVLYVGLEWLRKPPVKEIRHCHLSTYILGLALFLLAVVPTVIYFMDPKPTIGNPWFVLGIVISLSGVWIRASAMHTLGRLFSRFIGIQQGHHLVQSGLYRYIRHPGYLGTMFVFLGFAISTLSLTAVVVNLMVYLSAYSYRISVEERMLENQFGEEYQRYRESSWRLIPLVF